MTFKPASIGLALSVWAFFSSGCDEASFEVGVRVPGGFEVTRLELRIIRPPSSVDCEAIAFDEVPQAVLEANEELSVRLGVGEGIDLGELPRNQPTLFYAEGLSADGALLTAGCRVLPKIEEQSYEIVMEPASLLALSNPQFLVRRTADPTPSIDVSTTDVLGRPISTQIRYQVEDAVSAPQAASDRLQLSFEAPTAPGPFALTVRARWLAHSAPSTVGFVWPSQKRADLVLPGNVVGAAQSADALALLVGIQNGRWELGRSVPGQDAFSFSPPGQGDGPQIGRIDPESATVVSSAGWFSVNAAEVRASPNYIPGQGTPSLAADISDCDGGSELLAVTFEGGGSALYQGDGTQVGPLLDGSTSVLGAGCVENQAGGIERILVVDGNDGNALIALEGDVALRRDWFSLGELLYFSSNAQVLALQLEVNQFVISRSVVSIVDQQFDVVVLDTDVLPGLPTSLASGDVDGDGTIDVLGVYLDPADNTGLRLWMVRGASPKVAASTVFFEDAAELILPQLFLFDFDGDGAEEVVLADQARNRLLIYSFKTPASP